MSSRFSLLDKLTGGIAYQDDLQSELDDSETMEELPQQSEAEDQEEGQLAIDLYQTPTEIVIKAMIAGVNADDLEISISREMATIRGTRREDREVAEDGYYQKELYWGTFSRTIVLPEEVEPDEAEAVERHGMLIIRLPKINKHKQKQLRYRSM
ncbi:MAG: Hsp20/alpha crystallin family protein [Candidatus Vogelbacteria bacterium]|nr:Hsp20/alpha crystallin family protein [Candidatus Vogelbacteria bacterium]